MCVTRVNDKTDVTETEFMKHFKWLCRFAVGRIESGVLGSGQFGNGCASIPAGDGQALAAPWKL